MISDELLMAFADGVLDDGEKSRVAAALERDPALAARVTRLRETRAGLRAAFAGQLDIPPPPRMLTLFDSSAEDVGGADVLTLPRRQNRRPNISPTWAAAAAAGLVIAFLVGHASGPAPLIRMTAGGVLAEGALKRALNDQAAGGDGAMRVALSFPQSGGGFCRVFNAGPDTGLACGVRDGWRIVAMTSSPANAGSGVHQAAGAIAPAILAAADERRNGDPLDAAGERAAIRKAWR
jgi:hypothetical protein